MAMYHPAVQTMTKTLPLGLTITLPEDLYKQPVPSRTIVEIDLFSRLEDAFKRVFREVEITQEEIIENEEDFRKFLYCENMTSSELQAVMHTLCERVHGFRIYTAYALSFGDERIHPVKRVILPIYDALYRIQEEIHNTMLATNKMKQLMFTRFKIYYSIPYGKRVSVNAATTYIE